MAHLRLRKFNTRDAYPDQKLDNDLCMAVRAGNTVYLRGQTAHGPRRQDRRHRRCRRRRPRTRCECVKILLEEAGAQLEDIVKITIYITDRAYREPVYQVVGKWLKGVYPVRPA